MEDKNEVTQSKSSSNKRRRQRGSGGVYLRGKTYWIKYHKGRELFQESTGSSDERKARAILRTKLARITTGTFVEPKVEQVLVGDLLQGVVDDYKEQEQDFEDSQ